MSKETLEQKIERVLQDKIDIAPYDSKWPRLFQNEKAHLLQILPSGLIGKVEHFGSTAIPHLDAKPVIDMLVEVTSSEKAKEIIVPILEAEGYDYFWRPGFQGEPHYAWFIKRSKDGDRTHHIHMVETTSQLWQRLLFREYLIEHPEVAGEYQELKYALAKQHPNDQEAYTEGKGEFVGRITVQAVDKYLQRS